MKEETKNKLVLTILYSLGVIDIIIAYLNTSIIGTLATIFFVAFLLYFATLILSRKDT
ncbi:MAG: hypothetical protein ACP6IP_00425 [Candidatus Njordarchaeia archaeon]